MSYGYKCATCSRKDSEICEQCLGDQYAPIAKPVQSAEEQIKPWCAEEFAKDFLRAWVNTPDEKEAIRKMIRLIEADRAAQRQAGREEALVEMADNAVRLKKHYDDELAVIDARYAALVEAARRRVDPTTRCDECLLTELTEALRDLEGK